MKQTASYQYTETARGFGEESCFAMKMWALFVDLASGSDSGCEVVKRCCAGPRPSQPMSAISSTSGAWRKSPGVMVVIETIDPVSCASRHSWHDGLISTLAHDTRTTQDPSVSSDVRDVSAPILSDEMSRKEG